MFIACTELFKIGIGPSSSHTMGPMLAAVLFREQMRQVLLSKGLQENTDLLLECVLFGSLAYTGKGHATDQAVLLGVHGYAPEDLIEENVPVLVENLTGRSAFALDGIEIGFTLDQLVLNTAKRKLAHPNTLQFTLKQGDAVVCSERYVSIGGGFVVTEGALHVQALNIIPNLDVPFPFDSAKAMLNMAKTSGLSIAEMKRQNELERNPSRESLGKSIVHIWKVMSQCIQQGLEREGVLPGGLKVRRRASEYYRDLKAAESTPESHEWLSAYAMAVNEQNADGQTVVTAPTNGAAGVIPAVLYYFEQHCTPKATLTHDQIEDFFLTAAAIGGLIKHNSSISGAEVGCQGEVGSASAMAAAGLCALKGGSPGQIEHAAEIALEHHLGMTCDPVHGLVQVPCIERNAFGAVKAWLAVDLALRERSGHIMSLDSCIKAMHETGMAMSDKFKETSQAGLATSWVEC